MIKIIPFEDLGHHDFGWLNARYHFSFARYHNPDRMGFGALRVINDDIVQPGKGFDTHAHDNMEIITYVRKGAISHKDSKGNSGKTSAGDVQVMSAGTGIQHAEYNNEDGETNLYQIWIIPREKDVEPRWEARAFPKAPANDALPLLVSGYEEHAGQNAMTIHADAALYGGTLNQGTELTQPLKNLGYLLVSEGRVEIDGQEMKKGDGAEITDTNSITLKALENAEVVLIDVAA